MAYEKLGIQRRRLRHRAQSVFRAVLDIGFPPICLACKAPMQSVLDNIFLCPACQKELPRFSGPTCTRCGDLLPGIPSGTCRSCRDRRWSFDSVVSLGPYEGLLRQLILETKRATGEPVAMTLACLAGRRLGPELARRDIDVVVPIPMHWTRRVVRRTNGPEVVGQVLARLLHIPAAPRMLRRRRNTIRQFTLLRSGRFPNMRDAFVQRASYYLRDARVLLVDDILTTGATCHDAARALRAAGAVQVHIMVLARTLPPKS